MKKIVYSAPAKVILSGEHAVVYGKPALVSAIDLRLKFSLWKRQGSRDPYQVDKNIESVANLVRKFLKKNKNMRLDNFSYQYQIESEIPIARGLGSSAALSVAATAAFLEFYSGKKFDKETINNLAYQGEKKFHHHPSGVDNTASCFGGLLFYRKEFEFLKNFSLLNAKIPKKIEERLFLVDSGQPIETTGEMVKMVGDLYNKKPALVEQTLSHIEKATKRMVVSLIKEDVDWFKKTLSDNQDYLERLTVVSKKTKSLLSQLTKFGVGKITGAGGKKDGSGFLVFYADDVNRLKNFCQRNKISYFKFAQSSKGVLKLN